MTTRQLWRWQHAHERRVRAWRSPWLVAIAAGAVLHGPVTWSTHASAAAADRMWLAIALVAFAVAALRVPFHIYWRADASLLARLPIGGAPLVDVAIARCVRAACATTLALAIAAAPIARISTSSLVHDLTIAAALGACAGGLIPAAAFAAAAIVALDPRARAGAVLGALPGVTASIAIITCVLGRDDAALLVGLATASAVALAIARALAPRVMPAILRDVSALDRQHLATLEIKGPTAIERVIASLLGRAAITYRKDARLMRRRYPLAYALGGLAFLVLVIVALAQPEARATWLVATVAATAAYASVLARRLWRPPIELPRLTATLPISRTGRTVAKLAWIAAWAIVFVGAPLTFALVR
jgi:hypothetical protein